ncbi:pyruvate kinase [Desulfocapsa sulfexigens DSM 10523]|uniref:Pyruvate kinase n=1 Tax=Desulfocapsa sulfexigens (strain DSM 10523 / SB164P1) TaxID=1167006 RepID=M1P6E1_DESSD|nr:pyruvate kinase [Desulfocapsa sulfexigens]AGF77287.1 pyruvate kinase [Desulfocapsa sulfexigens DSM 10523]
MRKTKIIATLGPASNTVEQIHELILAGVDVFRVNLSHGDHESQAAFIAAIKTARARAGCETAILLDTRGPEIRTSDIDEGFITLQQGQTFFLTIDTVAATSERIGVNYQGLCDDVNIGDTVLLDDGKLALRVLSLHGNDIRTEVVVGGRLGEHKRVSLPGVKVNLPPLMDKDVSDIQFGAEMEVDFIAASFIRKGEDVLEVRRVIEEVGGRQQIISKIENQEALDNLEEILDLSDGLMVARGDLGVELPPEKVPVIQKKIIQMANRHGKPVITATQMLESMIGSPRPTRAEASDVTNAIFDGTDAVMLSGETAVGGYPLEAVRFLVKNAEISESALPYDELLSAGARYSTQTVSNAICYAACAIASDLQAHAILAATQSGQTARMVARHRPQPAIIATSPEASVRRQMQLLWGVRPLEVSDEESVNKLFDDAIIRAMESDLMKSGDTIVIIAGIPFKISGSTNMLKIHEVGDINLHGQGIGKETVTAEVTVIEDTHSLDGFKVGNILVACYTDNYMLDKLSGAAGIITEQPGLTSHAAIVGREKNIPVITGVKGAIEKLKSGQVVTMNCHHGQIYQTR